jgi:hypothetical protein
MKTGTKILIAVAVVGVAALALIPWWLAKRRSAKPQPVGPMAAPAAAPDLGTMNAAGTATTQ